MGRRARINLSRAPPAAAAAARWIRAGMAIDCAATRSPREPSAFIEAMERLLRATINTWHGLLAAARSEQAFRQELIGLVLAVPLAFLVTEEIWKSLALIGVVVFVLVDVARGHCGHLGTHLPCNRDRTQGAAPEGDSA